MLPFDPADPALVVDPYPTYASLRASDPVHFAAGPDVWVLSRHADIRLALRDWPSFSSAHGVELAEPLFGPGDLIVNDPPRHGVLRDLVARRFSARSVESLRPVLAERCQALLADLPAQGSIDAVVDYADRIPGATMCHVLGIPPDTAGWITDRVHRMMDRSSSAGVQALGEAAKDDLWSFFHEHLAAAAALDSGESGAPTTLIMDLARACRSGVLAESDVPGLCLSLITAGTETTTALMSTTLWRLANGEVSRDLVMPEGSVVDLRLLDEVLRVDSPIQWLTRMTTRDVLVGGQLIPATSRVVLLFASANRDEDVFAEADRIDVHRNQSESLAFGFGIHFCLGRLLSRLEAQVALSSFLNRYSVSGLAGVPQRFPSAWLRGFTRLPLAVTEH